MNCGIWNIINSQKLIGNGTYGFVEIGVALLEKVCYSGLGIEVFYD